jgi:hypothetical protein
MPIHAPYQGKAQSCHRLDGRSIALQGNTPGERTQEEMHSILILQVNLFAK